jgi:hypothetical protein
MGKQSFHTFRSLSATVLLLLLVGGVIKCEAVQRKPSALGWANHVQSSLDEKSFFVFSFVRFLYPPYTDLPRVCDENSRKCGQRLLHVTLLRSATRHADQVGLSQGWKVLYMIEPIAS